MVAHPVCDRARCAWNSLALKHLACQVREILNVVPRVVHYAWLAIATETGDVHQAAQPLLASALVSGEDPDLCKARTLCTSGSSGSRRPNANEPRASNLHFPKGTQTPCHGLPRTTGPCDIRVPCSSMTSVAVRGASPTTTKDSKYGELAEREHGNDSCLLGQKAVKEFRHEKAITRRCSRGYQWGRTPICK
ncbi:hypothetical protein VNO77_07963 [Canavalia gladiata]|uniref:Uncharacterized protein n=1 Tax=Canavalia gladiata TaxID=3824 RepID=A0AAN9QWE0_CANGL